MTRTWLRSSPGPKTGCSLFLGEVVVPPDVGVAILTRSEDRVQPGPALELGAGRGALRSSPGPKTGCSGLSGPVAPSTPGRCDPHPVRRPGAASPCRARSRTPSCCDPHPVRRPGAASTVPVPAAPVGCCDPHPVRRPGAARTRSLTPGRRRVLRSSPGPKTGCSDRADAPMRAKERLRSSPGPKTGCSLPLASCSCRPGRRCDPHPVRRPGAAGGLRAPDQGAPGCDPHPVRRPGAASRRSRRSITPTVLRSSPGPKTGCS